MFVIYIKSVSFLTILDLTCVYALLYLQTVSWLGAEGSVFEECVCSVSEPTHLRTLLHHHKHLGHLEQHGR